MDNTLLNKSLEEIENDFWEDTNFPTRLVEKCFYARKKKINDLEVEDLRLLITQKIGLKYIVPFSLRFLENDILIDAGIYEGDLLEAILKLPSSFWKENDHYVLWKKYMKLLEGCEDSINNSSEITEQIKNNILSAYTNFKQFSFS